jgi:hypothetical protein
MTVFLDHEQVLSAAEPILWWKSYNESFDHINGAVSVDGSTHIYRIGQSLPGHSCAASHFVRQSTGKKTVFTSVWPGACRIVLPKWPTQGHPLAIYRRTRAFEGRTRMSRLVLCKYTVSDAFSYSCEISVFFHPLLGYPCLATLHLMPGLLLYTD